MSASGLSGPLVFCYQTFFELLVSEMYSNVQLEVIVLTRSNKAGDFLPFSRGRNFWPHSQSKIAHFFPNIMSVFPNLEK